MTFSLPLAFRAVHDPSQYEPPTTRRRPDTAALLLAEAQGCDRRRLFFGAYLVLTRGVTDWPMAEAAS